MTSITTDEKRLIELTEDPESALKPEGKSSRTWSKLTRVICATVVFYSFVYVTKPYHQDAVAFISGLDPSSPLDLHKTNTCPQEQPLNPVQNAVLITQLEEEFKSDEFKNRAVGWLSGAVQVP